MRGAFMRHLCRVVLPCGLLGLRHFAWIRKGQKRHQPSRNQYANASPKKYAFHRLLRLKRRLSELPEPFLSLLLCYTFRGFGCGASLGMNLVEREMLIHPPHFISVLGKYLLNCRVKPFAKRALKIGKFNQRNGRRRIPLDMVVFCYLQTSQKRSVSRSDFSFDNSLYLLIRESALHYL